MTVTPDCSSADIVVKLDVAAGEYLRYEVTADDCVTYTLTCTPGDPIISSDSCPSPCTNRWPPVGEEPSSGQYKQPFGMVFADNGECTYVVKRHAADDSVIKVVKNCKYTGSAGDTYFEPMRVKVQ